MDVTAISGWHAHIYYDHGDPGGAGRARAVRDALVERFDAEAGMWREVPGGPHTSAGFQASFTVARFDAVVPWLMLNRDGLAILIHPLSGDEVADHGDYAVWIGDILPVNFDALR